MALVLAEAHQPGPYKEAHAVRVHNRNAARVDTSPHQLRAGQQVLVKPVAMAHSPYVDAIPVLFEAHTFAV